MTAQLLDITPDEYHARDEFSSSLAKIILAQSPLHAKHARGKEPTKKMDRGQVVHRLTLGKGSDYEVLDYADWRKNEAKAARDKARAAGKVPILVDDFGEANVIAEAIRVALGDRGLFLDGASEQVIVWTESTPHGPVACRAMLDHVWLSVGTILDLKVTENVAADAIERTAENLGYAMQAAAYTRALEALMLTRERFDLVGRVRFMFAFAEESDPYHVCTKDPDGIFRELGERRWLAAVNKWGECLATDKWPGPPDGYISSPPWALAREGFTTEER